MKALLPLALLCMMISCSPKEEFVNNMPGTYKMLSQNFKSDDSDTTLYSVQQLKIFTADHMIYANYNMVDSTCNFGIGRYTYNHPDTLIEDIIYTAFDTSANPEPVIYTLLIDKTDKGYRQVINDLEMQGTKYVLTEEYERVSISSKSPLNGAWKLIKVVHVDGADTVLQDLMQFKVYQDAHFIWGQSFTDSKGQRKNNIGFGTFIMEGTTMLTETVNVSSLPEIRGKSVEIEVDLKSENEFRQTITEPNGRKIIETYQRIVK